MGEECVGKSGREEENGGEGESLGKRGYTLMTLTHLLTRVTSACPRCLGVYKKVNLVGSPTISRAAPAPCRASVSRVPRAPLSTQSTPGVQRGQGDRDGLVVTTSGSRCVPLWVRPKGVSGWMYGCWAMRAHLFERARLRALLNIRPFVLVDEGPLFAETEPRAVPLAGGGENAGASRIAPGERAASSGPSALSAQSASSVPVSPSSSVSDAASSRAANRTSVSAAGAPVRKAPAGGPSQPVFSALDRGPTSPWDPRVRIWHEIETQRHEAWWRRLRRRLDPYRLNPRPYRPQAFVAAYEQRLHPTSPTNDEYMRSAPQRIAPQHASLKDTPPSLKDTPASLSVTNASLSGTNASLTVTNTSFTDERVPTDTRGSGPEVTELGPLPEEVRARVSEGGSEGGKGLLEGVFAKDPRRMLVYVQMRMERLGVLYRLKMHQPERAWGGMDTPTPEDYFPSALRLFRLYVSNPSAYAERFAQMKGFKGFAQAKASSLPITEQPFVSMARAQEDAYVSFVTNPRMYVQPTHLSPLDSPSTPISSPTQTTPVDPYTSSALAHTLCNGSSYGVSYRSYWRKDAVESAKEGVDPIWGIQGEKSRGSGSSSLSATPGWIDDWLEMDVSCAVPDSSETSSQTRISLVDLTPSPAVPPVASLAAPGTVWRAASDEVEEWVPPHPLGVKRSGPDFVQTLFFVWYLLEPREPLCAVQPAVNTEPASASSTLSPSALARPLTIPNPSGYNPSGQVLSQTRSQVLSQTTLAAPQTVAAAVPVPSAAVTSSSAAATTPLAAGTSSSAAATTSSASPMAPTKSQDDLVYPKPRTTLNLATHPFFQTILLVGPKPEPASQPNALSPDPVNGPAQGLSYPGQSSSGQDLGTSRGPRSQGGPASNLQGGSTASSQGKSTANLTGRPRGRSFWDLGQAPRPQEPFDMPYSSTDVRNISVRPGERRPIEWHTLFQEARRRGLRDLERWRPLKASWESFLGYALPWDWEPALWMEHVSVGRHWSDDLPLRWAQALRLEFYEVWTADDHDEPDFDAQSQPREVEEPILDWAYLHSLTQRHRAPVTPPITASTQGGSTQGGSTPHKVSSQQEGSAPHGGSSLQGSFPQKGSSPYAGEAPQGGSGRDSGGVASVPSSSHGSLGTVSPSATTVSLQTETGSRLLSSDAVRSPTRVSEGTPSPRRPSSPSSPSSSPTRSSSPWARARDGMSKGTVPARPPGPYMYPYLTGAAWTDAVGSAQWMRDADARRAALPVTPEQLRATIEARMAEMTSSPPQKSLSDTGPTPAPSRATPMTDSDAHASAPSSPAGYSPQENSPMGTPAAWDTPLGNSPRGYPPQEVSPEGNGERTFPRRSPFEGLGSSQPKVSPMPSRPRARPYESPYPQPERTEPRPPARTVAVVPPRTSANLAQDTLGSSVSNRVAGVNPSYPEIRGDDTEVESILGRYTPTYGRTAPILPEHLKPENRGARIHKAHLEFRAARAAEAAENAEKAHQALHAQRTREAVLKPSRSLGQILVNRFVQPLDPRFQIPESERFLTHPLVPGSSRMHALAPLLPPLPYPPAWTHVPESTPGLEKARRLGQHGTRDPRYHGPGLRHQTYPLALTLPAAQPLSSPSPLPPPSPRPQQPAPSGQPSSGPSSSNAAASASKTGPESSYSTPEMIRAAEAREAKEEASRLLSKAHGRLRVLSDAARATPPPGSSKA